MIITSGDTRCKEISMCLMHLVSIFHALQRTHKMFSITRSSTFVPVLYQSGQFHRSFPIVLLASCRYYWTLKYRRWAKSPSSRLDPCGFYQNVLDEKYQWFVSIVTAMVSSGHRSPTTSSVDLYLCSHRPFNLLVALHLLLAVATTIAPDRKSVV